MLPLHWECLVYKKHLFWNEYGLKDVEKEQMIYLKAVDTIGNYSK